MSMSTSLFFFSFLFLGFISISSSHSTSSATTNCPLDFTIPSHMRQASRNSKNHITQCVSILQGIRLVQSEYLLRTNTFLISTAFSQACWQSLQSVFDKYPKHFDIQNTCDFHVHFITQGCHNITTKAQYEAKNSRSALKNVEKACKHSSYNRKSCALCNSYISRLEPSGTYKVPPSDIMKSQRIDPQHRYGHSLHLYYEEWCKADAGQPFFYWLVFLFQLRIAYFESSDFWISQKMISAYSGHYRPTDERLDSFLSFLKDNGVDLDEVEVRKASEDAENKDDDTLSRDGSAEVTTPESLQPDNISKIEDIISVHEETEVKNNYRRTLSGGLQSPRADVPKNSLFSTKPGK
ncbi:hypothetical protein POM88_021752 [Heracleum sosnowskyi]|uniref:SPARK domain-containing protein n=1 Tax=Heracleum sosnowskyi TaxID=360622 RepID=A0AAD8MT31_9APIA|nr:hypothetical protein POM88_021752 [Heracleum sosnowskyi]